MAKSKGPGGRPSTTGNPSGGGRDNASERTGKGGSRPSPSKPSSGTKK